LLKVFLGDLLEVTTDRELTGDVHREALRPIGLPDDLEDIADALFLLPGQYDGKNRGVTVRGDKRLAAGVEVAGHLLHAVASTQFVGQTLHAFAKGRGRRGELV
jgi:hypothetical protein